MSSAAATAAGGLDPGSMPREPAWRVAKQAIGYWTVSEIIGWLFFLVPAVVASFVVPESVPGWLDTLIDLLPWAVLVLAVASTLILPRFRYAVHRWEVTEEGIFTLTGWLSLTWVLVPISRIQTVDVNRGPLQRMFGLASVAVRTASAQGTVTIDQLDHRTAVTVADDLSHRANLTDDDAT